MAKVDAELLRDVEQKGGSGRWGAYLRLSGPGWLQSALKLGAGTMSSSLYLGVLAGFSLLWLQPLAMLLGIIMLSAIGYVTMSTGKRPFQAINEHVSPVLGYGWALAALAASVLWAVPQYSLAIGVVQQNLMPAAFGPTGTIGDFPSKLIIVTLLIAVSTVVVWSYGGSSKGLRFFDWALKIMVMLIVLSFIGVVVRLAFAPRGLEWGALFSGFIPNPGMFFRPADGFIPLIGAVAADYQAYWHELIVSRQRDVIVAAAAASAGVNGTFLFAYTILRRGWGKEFRRFSRFDLLTSMFIPFAIASSCVVIAGATQFHTVPEPGFTMEAGAEPPTPRQASEYRNLLSGRVIAELPAGTAPLGAEELARRIEALSPADKQLAATLVTRDAFGLAASLRPFTGPLIANYIFGFGVLGMCLSSIILQMLIAGFVICELMGRPHTGWPLRLGSLAAAVGALVPFFWTQAYFWLAVPTSVFAAMLIPVAHLTFILMMNQPTLLGREMPRGRRRIIWNSLMLLALGAFAASGIFMIWDRSGYWGLAAVLVFIVAVVATRKTGVLPRPPHLEREAPEPAGRM